jgi:hypothetical protein
VKLGQLSFVIVAGTLLLLKMLMRTIKQELEILLKRLPDDCTLEDVQYHLYVLTKVREGLKAVATEGTITQAQAEQRLSKWLIP